MVSIKPVLVACLILAEFSSIGSAGRYLVWLPISSRSIKIGFMSPVLELVRRGHQATVVSPYKTKEAEFLPGLTDINNECQLSAVTDKVSANKLLHNVETLPFFDMVDTGISCNRNALRTAEMQDILSGPQKFDVVITMPAMGSEVGYMLAHKLNASMVFFFTGTYSMPWINWAVGNPHNPAYMPLPLLPYPQDMNFLQRLTNTVATAALNFVLKDYFINSRIDALLDETFPNEGRPSLRELENKAALLVTHGSPFLGDGLRPVSPNTVMAALLTCHPAKKLPDDLRQWVEGAEHGVIYISFGSVVKPSEMSEERRKMFLTIFKGLKQRIIWKWDKPMPDKSDNILISSWVPQHDLLDHPNVKLFITHGGAGSTQETICYKKPIIGIPIFGDQMANLNDAVNKNIGIVIKWEDLTEQVLTESIEKVLTDPTYKESISKLSDLILDQPMHPLNKTVWWLEYLLRHPGNTDMESPAKRLAWHQYFLLDVILVVALALFLAVFVIVKCFSFVWRTVAPKAKKD